MAADCGRCAGVASGDESFDPLRLPARAVSTHGLSAAVASRVQKPARTLRHGCIGAISSWIESLEGQAHEAMSTAPEMYAESVFRPARG